jgi:hypothetical protein
MLTILLSLTLFEGGGGRACDRDPALRASQKNHKKKICNFTVCNFTVVTVFTVVVYNYHIMSYSYAGLEAAYEAFAGRDEPDLILCPVEHAIWLFYACWGFVPDGYLPPSGPGFSCQ